MNCDEAQELISDYVDDELDADSRQTLQAHLHLCEVCQSELKAHEMVRQRLRNWEMPGASADFENGLSMRLPKSSRVNKIVRVMAMSLSAGVAAAVFLLMNLMPQQRLPELANHKNPKLISRPTVNVIRLAATVWEHPVAWKRRAPLAANVTCIRLRDTVWSYRSVLKKEQISQ